MPVLKRLSDSFFGWISPRSTHEGRDAKPFKSSDIRSAAAAQAAARRSKAKMQVATISARKPGSPAVLAGKPQVATKNVDFRRKSRYSGEIPWEETPPSSPLIVESIEHGMAAAALYDDDEMEDAGDEGAIDEMSDEDESGVTEEESEEDEDEYEEDDDGSLDGVEPEAKTAWNAESVNRKSDHSQRDDSAQLVSSEGESEEDEENEEDDDDVYDANEKTKMTDLEVDHEAALIAASQKFELDRDAQLEKQKVDAMILLRDGWNMDTVELYMFVERRVYETLLPETWQTDFPLFPWNNFASDYRQAFIGGKDPSNDYIMIRALRDFLKLPVHVRNQIRIKAWYGRRAEAMVVKYCEDYMKLIHKDAKLYVPLKKQKLYSLICYAPGDEKTPVDQLEGLILTRLRKRAGKLLGLLRTDEQEPLPGRLAESNLYWHDGIGYIYEPPTLYGIVVKEAVIALVAYEPLSARDALRTIAFFHMSKANHDVWNALALAIVMCHCRNHLSKIKDRLPENLDDLELTEDETDL